MTDPLSHLQNLLWLVAPASNLITSYRYEGFNFYARNDFTAVRLSFIDPGDQRR